MASRPAASSIIACTDFIVSRASASPRRLEPQPIQRLVEIGQGFRARQVVGTFGLRREQVLDHLLDGLFVERKRIGEQLPNESQIDAFDQSVARAVATLTTRRPS